MMRRYVSVFVLMMPMWFVQCQDHSTQFDFIGGKYDNFKLPDTSTAQHDNLNTSGPFLVQVHMSSKCSDFVLMMGCCFY